MSGGLSKHAIGVAVASIAGLCSCNSSPSLPALEITSVSPASKKVDDTAELVISGSGFRVQISNDLNEGELSVGQLEVFLGETALLEIVLDGETQLRVLANGELAPGQYDLRLVASDGRSATLPAAFVIEQPCENDGDCTGMDSCSSTSECISERCEPGPADKDTDMDGYIDQDCGGDDCDDDDNEEFPGQQWYPDSDNDGLGDPDSTPNECERANPTDVLNPFDCDDDGMGGDDGRSCDDDDICTDYDTCREGMCEGVNTCEAQCRDDCSGGCGMSGCCKERCGGGCQFSDCEPGCSCDLTCNATSCNTTCNAGAVCILRADASTDVNLGCSSDAICTEICSAQNTNCTLNCNDSASCLLECGGATNCTLNCSGEATVDCGSGVLACRRNCPL